MRRKKLSEKEYIRNVRKQLHEKEDLQFYGGDEEKTEQTLPFVEERGEVRYLSECNKPLSNSEVKASMKGNGAVRALRFKRGMRKVLRSNTLQGILTLCALVVFVYAAYTLIDNQSEIELGTGFYGDLGKEIIPESDKHVPLPQASYVPGSTALPEIDFPEGVIKTTVDPSTGEEVEVIDMERIPMPTTIAFYPDTVGWISIPNVDGRTGKVNYPIMQGVDNDQYVYTLPNGQSNRMGSIFLDSACDPVNYSPNSIIYGHNMNNGEMFGTLYKFVREKQYCFDHMFIYTSTEDTVSVWCVFSTYTIHEASDYRKIDFASEDEFQAYYKLMRSRSLYQDLPYPETIDRMLTLSTCFGPAGTDKRTVIHAYLMSTYLMDNKVIYRTPAPTPTPTPTPIPTPTPTPAPTLSPAEVVMAWEDIFGQVKNEAGMKLFYDNTGLNEANISVPYGQFVQVIYRMPESDSVVVCCDGVLFWASAADLELKEVGFKPGYGMIKADGKVNVREQATTSSDIVTKVSEGEKFWIVTEITDGWYGVVTKDGQSGYILGELIQTWQMELETITEEQINTLFVVRTPEPTPTPTPTPAPSRPATLPPATKIPVHTATPEVTPTATPEEMPTATPEVTPTATPEETPTATPEVTPTPTPEEPPTATPEVTPTPTPEEPPTATPEVTPTPTPEEPPTATPEVTPTPTPEEPPTATPEATPTPTPEEPPTATPEVTPTPTPETTPESEEEPSDEE